jgi:methionyl aminopeptidase
MKYPIKSEEEIAIMRKGADLLGRTFGAVKKHIRPGVSTLELDQIAEDFIRSNGAIPAFKNYVPSRDHTPFPGTLCTSIDFYVVHGVPKAEAILQEGQIISVDCGLCIDGFFADSAYTFPVGEVSTDALRLMQITKESLYLGIHQAVSGQRIGDLAAAIQTHVEMNGFSVVRQLVGHGIGKRLHEPPEVPNFGKRGNGVRMQEGLVIAIEPMINQGKAAVRTDVDGWSILTEDRKLSAHFEHTVVVRKGQAEVLTTFDYIEN